MKSLCTHSLDISFYDVFGTVRYFHQSDNVSFLCTGEDENQPSIRCCPPDERRTQDGISWGKFWSVYCVQ